MPLEDELLYLNVPSGSKGTNAQRHVYVMRWEPWIYPPDIDATVSDVCVLFFPNTYALVSISGQSLCFQTTEDNFKPFLQVERPVVDFIGAHHFARAWRQDFIFV